VIFACFNVMIYIEFELIVHFVNYIVLIKIFYFLGKFVYLLRVCNGNLLVLFFQLDSLLIICTI
jgi:hypothetical protein